jgi:hypothetical protein
MSLYIQHFNHFIWQLMTLGIQFVFGATYIAHDFLS